MTTTDPQSYENLIDQAVIDQAGNKVGKVSQVYVDDQTGQPEWLAITTGMFKSRSSFVPLDGVTSDGDNLVIPFDKSIVKDAPQVDEDGSLSPEEEAELYRYYSRDYTPGTGQPSFATEPRGSAGDAGFEGRDVSGVTTDDAMTRSEEEIRVGTERREAGRARLRKYVVTEQVTQTVPVSREEVRIEREPITEANYDAATSGPQISEEEHEVVLHEERPVVQKEVIPKERVRLSADTVVGEETVSDEVRKEQIDTDGTAGV